MPSRGRPRSGTRPFEQAISSARSDIGYEHGVEGAHAVDTRHGAARLGTATWRRPAHAQFLQDYLQRAEARERGLEEVEPDKNSEPKPVRAVKAREQETQQNK